MNFTHTDLCRLGAEWLLRRHRCAVAAYDVRGIMLRELADAIGWKTDGVSFLIEAKTSRADFFRQMKKPHMAQRNPAPGLGVWRWFITPRGLVKPEELPPRWGLVEVSEACDIRQRHKPKPFPAERVDARAELATMVWIHRLCPPERVLVRERQR